MAINISFYRANVATLMSTLEFVPRAASIFEIAGASEQSSKTD